MIKLNLITKKEQEQLEKLKQAHRFYLNNFKASIGFPFDRSYLFTVKQAEKSMKDFGIAVKNHLNF